MMGSQTLCVEEAARLRRIGVTDALLDCLALVMREPQEAMAVQRTVQQWVAETGTYASTSDNTGRHRGARLILPWGAPATEEEAGPLAAGMREGYAACSDWLAAGLERDALATRLLQRVFAEWPQEASDYQRRYDAYLEKELRNPRAIYYASSRVWRTEVDNLRTRVTCPDTQGHVLDERLLRRAVKLLHTHPERLTAGSQTAGSLPAGSEGSTNLGTVSVAPAALAAGSTPASPVRAAGGVVVPRDAGD